LIIIVALIAQVGLDGQLIPDETKITDWRGLEKRAACGFKLQEERLIKGKIREFTGKVPHL